MAPTRSVRSTRFAALGLIFAALLAPAPARAAKPSAKEQKINAYVQIINGESNHVFDSRRTYSAWANMKTGPTCKESGLRGPSALGGDSAPARFKKYRAALAKGPKLEADPAAIEMVDALEALLKAQNEASEYYHKNLYKKDDCKRGQELHPLLVAGWAKYSAGDRAVRDFVEKYQDERDVKELADLEKKYGKRLRYHHRKLLLDGKYLVREADAQSSQAKPDVAVIRGKLEPFSQTLDGAKAIVEKEKQGKNAKPLYEGGYEQLIAKAGWYRDAVKELLRQLEAPPTKEPKSSVDERRKRAVKQIIESYNAMIEESNKVGYSKSMK